jgi:hypothetical protein
LPQLRSNSYGLCPTIIEIQHNLMPYFTRLKEMDRVGVEPTTSALLCSVNPTSILLLTDFLLHLSELQRQLSCHSFPSTRGVYPTLPSNLSHI